MSDAVLRTLETLALSGASALTSGVIGNVVDSSFPAAIPAQDTTLLLYIALQFGLSTWGAAEVYQLLMSLRGADVPPPPIGDGVAVFFLYYSQPNFRAKFDELVKRLRGKVHARFPAMAPVTPTHPPGQETGANGGGV